MVAGIKPEFASTLTTATCGLNLIPAAENSGSIIFGILSAIRTYSFNYAFAYFKARLLLFNIHMNDF